MRILNLFLDPLFPLSAGNRANTYQMCKELVRQGHEVGLVHLSYTDRSVRRKTPATLPFREEVSLPSPLLQPMVGILRRIANRIWQATLGTPVDLPYVFSRANRREVRRILEEGRYDILVVHYVFAAARLEEMVPPGVRTVCFTHCLWFQNYERQRLANLRSKRRLLAAIRKSEYGLLRKFDAILVVGDYEKEALVRDGFDPARVLLCGVASDVAAAASDAPKRHDLLFVAGISVHNNDAMRAFLDCVLPRMRAMGLHYELACAGKICQLPWIQGIPGVKPLGFVDDLERLYAETQLVVNPVRVGVGVKVKVVEALAQGCAVLTTSNGAEGIGAPPGKALLVCDDLDRWPDLIAEWLSDGKRLAALRREALRWSRDHISAETVFSPLTAWIAGAPAIRTPREPALRAAAPLSS